MSEVLTWPEPGTNYPSKHDAYIAVLKVGLSRHEALNQTTSNPHVIKLLCGHESGKCDFMMALRAVKDCYDGKWGIARDSCYEHSHDVGTMSEEERESNRVHMDKMLAWRAAQLATNPSAVPRKRSQKRERSNSMSTCTSGDDTSDSDSDDDVALRLRQSETEALRKTHLTSPDRTFPKPEPASPPPTEREHPSSIPKAHSTMMKKMVSAKIRNYVPFLDPQTPWKYKSTLEFRVHMFAAFKQRGFKARIQNGTDTYSYFKCREMGCDWGMCVEVDEEDGFWKIDRTSLYEEHSHSILSDEKVKERLNEGGFAAAQESRKRKVKVKERMVLPEYTPPTPTYASTSKLPPPSASHPAPAPPPPLSYSAPRHSSTSASIPDRKPILRPTFDDTHPFHSELSSFLASISAGLIPHTATLLNLGIVSMDKLVAAVHLGEKDLTQLLDCNVGGSRKWESEKLPPGPQFLIRNALMEVRRKVMGDE